VRDLSFRAKDLFVAAIDMFGVVQFRIPKPRNARTLHLKKLDCEISRFLVASPPVRDLLLCAKHLSGAAIALKYLFVAAIAVWVCARPVTSRRLPDALAGSGPLQKNPSLLDKSGVRSRLGDMRR